MGFEVYIGFTIISFVLGVSLMAFCVWSNDRGDFRKVTIALTLCSFVPFVHIISAIISAVIIVVSLLAMMVEYLDDKMDDMIQERKNKAWEKRQAEYEANKAAAIAKIKAEYGGSK